jgi:hypothetical protein
VSDRRTDESIPSHRIGARIQGGNLRADSWDILRKDNFNGLTFAQGLTDLLSYGEVDESGIIDALKRGKQSAGFEVLAGMDVSETDASAERSTNCFASDDCFGAGDLCLGDVAFGACAIEFHLGGGAILDSAFHAGEERLREGSLSFLRFQLRFLNGNIKSDEDCASLDNLAGHKLYLLDRAWKFVAQSNGTSCDDSSDGSRGAAVRTFPGSGDHDRLDLLGLIGGGGVGLCESIFLPEGECNAG